MWFSHTMEYNLAIKRNEVLTHATTWMSLENIILSERMQSQNIRLYDSFNMKRPEYVNP